jgi:hypothetical protein
MYALVHNSQLILGPIKYNYLLINGELEELEINAKVSPRDYERVPIIFDANTALVSVVQTIPTYDERFESLGNFEWSIFQENGYPERVDMTYTINNKTLEQIKEEYKARVAPIRWEKENGQLITITVNNTQVQVYTSREERDQFVSKLVSCSGIQNATHNYKFRNDVWVEIGCTEIEYILQQIDMVVQDAFDWEYTKLQEIDACTTGQEVYAVDLT